MDKTLIKTEGIIIGIVLKWDLPDTSQVTYDYTEIYRATSVDGTYSLIATQVISDNSYFDIDGSTSSYYKIRFQDSSASKYSDYSTALQGGNFNGYCTFDDIRAITGITSSQLTDSQLFNIIKDFAIGELNKDLAIEWRDERVLYLSLEKQNKIDGSTTTYYTRHWPLCDLNNDGIVDENDIEFYTLDGTGTRTAYTVSSVDDVWLGKFTLSSAPTVGERPYIKRYRSSPVEVYPNTDPAIRKACALLAGSIAMQRIEAGIYGSWRTGKVSVTKRNPAMQVLRDQYNQIINKIKRDLIKEKKSRDASEPLDKWGKTYFGRVI